MSDYNEMVRNLRAQIKRNEFYIEKRTGDGDRRKSYFSFVDKDRRVDTRRHNEAH
jgi:hypothetical protein